MTKRKSDDLASCCMSCVGQIVFILLVTIALVACMALPLILGLGK